MLLIDQTISGANCPTDGRDCKSGLTIGIQENNNSHFHAMWKENMNHGATFKCICSVGEHLRLLQVVLTRSMVGW